MKSTGKFRISVKTNIYMNLSDYLKILALVNILLY